MPTLTPDDMPPELQRAYRARMTTIPHPIPPEAPPMHQYDIRFTYSLPNGENRSDIKRLEAKDSPSAIREFNDWFKESYDGAPLRSMSVVQVPDFINPRA